MRYSHLTIIKDHKIVEEFGEMPLRLSQTTWMIFNKAFCKENKKLQRLLIVQYAAGGSYTGRRAEEKKFCAKHFLSKLATNVLLTHILVVVAFELGRIRMGNLKRTASYFRGNGDHGFPQP